MRAILGVFAAVFVMVAVSARPEAQAGPQLSIAAVAVVGNQMTITGTGFGSAAVVTLAESQLAVVSNSDAEVVAEIPTMTSGIYELTVSRNGGATPDDKATTHVVIQ